MKNPIGRKRWAIAEGYIPEVKSRAGTGNDQPRDGLSAQYFDQDAHVQIMVYFSDKDPVGPYRVIVPANRTKHLRFNDLKDPEPIPRGTDYASVIESDVPIVVQHTRLDSRQNANALLTTIAFASAD